MKERLDIARKLLSNSGMIFISIDDNEYANLKLLCDQIFGEENFVANIINQSANSVFGTKAAHKERTFIKVKDYVLVYKNGADCKLQPLYTPSRSYLHDSHDFIYENGIKCSTVDWFKTNYKEFFIKYGLKINKQTINTLLNIDVCLRKEIVERLLDIQFRTGGVFSEDNLSEDQLKKLSNSEIVEHNGMLLYRENNGKGKTNFLRSLKDSCQIIDGEWRKCDILGDVWNNSAGYGNINAEGNIKFLNGKKPLMLLKRILTAANNKNAIVLDFFAGSGTTGHAVMELNAEDGGNRRFILCTNNEISASRTLDYLHYKGYLKKIKSTGKNKSIQSKLDEFFKENPDVYYDLIENNCIEYETYGICQSVTYIRLCNAVKGFKENILYFQTEMVDKYDDDLDELLYEASILLTELENMSLIDNKSICIADNDEAVDEIIYSVTDELKVVYIADDVLLDNRQRDFFSRHKIEVKQIPNYYYKEF